MLTRECRLRVMFPVNSKPGWFAWQLGLRNLEDSIPVHRQRKKRIFTGLVLIASKVDPKTSNRI